MGQQQVHIPAEVVPVHDYASTGDLGFGQAGEPCIDPR